MGVQCLGQIGASVKVRVRVDSVLKGRWLGLLGACVDGCAVSGTNRCQC